MPSRITPSEAARALAAIASSRAAMRTAVRAHRGHTYLWLWGGIWTAMALLAHFRGLAGVQLFSWMGLGGVVASFLIGRRERSTIRLPVDRRFLRVLAASLLFGLAWLTALGGPRTPEHGFAYIGLLVAQAYVIAGLWFDSYLLALGLMVAATMLTGLFAFPAFFWIWIAVAGGGTLIASGFYVRYGMR